MYIITIFNKFNCVSTLQLLSISQTSKDSYPDFVEYLNKF